MEQSLYFYNKNKDYGKPTNIRNNHTQSLSGKEAIAKLTELAEGAKTCFFCTNIKTGLPLTASPMELLKVDNEGNLWFMSVKISQRNQDIQKDPFTHLFFQEHQHAGFLNVYGVSEIILDKAKIEELWKPIHKVWFQEGVDDPNISLIKVVPTQSYYWDTKNGQIVAFAKMALSIITGKTMDDSIEGKLEL